MSAECSKCGPDVYDECRYCATRAERDRYKAALEVLADPENWSGKPGTWNSSLYGHFTPYELAVNALAKDGK